MNLIRKNLLLLLFYKPGNNALPFPLPAFGKTVEIPLRFDSSITGAVFGIISDLMLSAGRGIIDLSLEDLLLSLNTRLMSVTPIAVDELDFLEDL